MLALRKLLNRMSKPKIITMQTLNSNPIIQFKQWLSEANNSSLFKHQWMVLSTCSKDNKPSSRTVILREVDENGFKFFTNLESKKAHQIEENENVSLLFYWDSLQRQVQIEGIAKKLNREENMKDYSRRHVEARKTLFASNQSRAVDGDRKELEDYFFNKLKEFKDDYPDHWGGYIVIPNMIEFCQLHLNGIHDRICYRRKNQDENWNMERLYP